MNCPKCRHPNFDPVNVCPRCQFQGDSSLIEELAHIDWILDEISSWQVPGLTPHHRQRLQETYQARQRKLQVDLELRLPPFTPTQARRAWPELIQRRILLEKVEAWHQANLLKPGSTEKMLNEAKRQIDELQQQLEGYIEPHYPRTDAEHLEVVIFLLQAVTYLSQYQCFVTSEAETQVQFPLQNKKTKLELGSVVKPVPEKVEKIPDQSSSEPDTLSEITVTPQLAPAASTQSVVPPSIPLGERIWRTLLSERTLHVLLFLGIFLFFTAAISFVIWGWDNFSAPVRVAIPVLFTVSFFGLGWYVRTITSLYRSGIALSAIAALLIPIDFYTIYVNFNIPQNYWASFWFITSVFCLLAYIAAAVIIRSRLYGYLVGLAAGSTMLALIELGHQNLGLSTDWRTAGLASVALVLLAASILLEQYRAKKFTYFTESFRYLSFLTISIVLILTLAWRLIDRNTVDILHYALSIDWWIGTIIFGWGAIFYRHRGLGVLAAITLPVAMFLTQAALFDQTGIEPAWHAFGFALLVPIYLIAGYALQGYEQDPVLRSFSKTAIGTGIILLIIVTGWSIAAGNGWVTACSHLVLAVTVALAALLWRRPFYLYIASLFSLTALSAAMVEWQGDWSLLSIAFASLAILHIIVAWQAGSRFPSPLPNYAGPLVISGYIIAALSIVPVVIPYNGDILVYAVANWGGLSAWGAYLAHKQQSGFTSKNRFGKTVFHWFTAVTIPVWVWLFVLNTNLPDIIIALALAIVAWVLALISYRLKQINPLYQTPWWLVGISVSVIAPIFAFSATPPGIVPGITLLLAGLLYFSDAIVGRRSVELIPAGLATAWGYLLLLDQYFGGGPLYIALALLIAIYILVGLGVERKKSTTFTHHFLSPLYLTSHFLSLFLLTQIYIYPIITSFYAGYTWPDELKIWGAGAQLILGLVYACYAWGTYKERWGHVATWLIAAGAGLVAITLSTGRGSSAAKAALFAIAYILAERGLNWLQQRPGVNRKQAYLRLLWYLYRRPLLATGWAISAIAIMLALGRNLVLLGGGQIQQVWAAIALILVTALFVASARLFRQVRFMWLGSFLIIAPWTILTNLGWFTGYYPTVPGFAISWSILAWGLFVTGLILGRYIPAAYLFPLKMVAHLLIPFSLLWGIADVDTSCFTFGLAVMFYTLAAWLDHRQFVTSETHTSALTATKFFYPAVSLIPIWSVYLLASFLPASPRALYGILILGFAAFGLVVGRWLDQIAPQIKMAHSYGFPGYLIGYICMGAGTLLAAHEPSLLALALLYDAMLFLISTWLFMQPVWLYLALTITPLSLLFALSVTAIPVSRYGWWLMALASIYLVIAWILRRGKLKGFGTAPLAVGLILVAIGLVPSSLDQNGALWGYIGAVVIYATTAFWLRRPLLLLPASLLTIVPYSILLQKSPIDLEYYGVALLPGAVIALGIGWGLDMIFGRWVDFPWNDPIHWLPAIGSRILGWWGFSPFLIGFSLALASPMFSTTPRLLAFNFLLLVPILGWAVYYFRLRIWLLALGITGQLCVVFYLDALGWWSNPDEGSLRFLPIVWITTIAALVIEYYKKEDSPLSRNHFFRGWSRPLYLLALVDIMLCQYLSLHASWSGFIVTISNMVLVAILASIWLSKETIFIALILGVIALIQRVMIVEAPVERLPVALAGLTLGYGVAGYGLTILRRQLKDKWTIPQQIIIWEIPLQNFSIVFSLGVLSLTFWWGTDVILWTPRATLNLAFRNSIELALVQMMVEVFALLGILYLLDAFVYRRLREYYIAIGMILASWLLQAFYIQQFDNIMWYVLPTSFYLLGIGYLEWRKGNKTLGRWLDYFAIILLTGTLFRQTLVFGLIYALSLGAIGFMFIWWGTARRLRRFLYAGSGAVVLGAIGELVNQLSSINQWIVFGAIGLLVIIIAILIERKLDDIKAWQELETWE